LQYKYDELKSKKKDDKDKAKSLTDVTFFLKDGAALKKVAKGILAGEILGEATNFARDLGNAPSNYMTPTLLAERAQQASKGLGIKFKALGKKECQSLKMGCFLGVNKGSAEEPKFIIMEYSGGKKSEKPIAFVGKGLTFDTGGISIKPSANLEDMKFDMCGGAAVIATIVAIARLKLKVNVVGLVPSTENMPGGAAIKPGDILTAMNGKTVEVNNTDAEGRLILADALVYACEHYKPRAIFDAATLTGACVIALGNVYSGFFAKDAKLLKQIHASSDASGERLWQLPLVDEYVDDMKGTYADLSNISSGKGGGSSTGAAFLSQFVNADIPWAHFDIAPTAYNASRYAYNPDKGATGVIVRLFSQLAMDL
jgi:leucyl aminopeptidase